MSDLSTGASVSPLVEIEQGALEIANERNIGLEQDTADDQLRAIVTELVEQWRADYLRGIRLVDLGEPQLIIERAMSNLVGYGPLAALLDDDDVWEIMLNAPAETLEDAWGTQDLTDEEIVSYWEPLIEANKDRLVDPGNPDLILPDQELVLPTPPTSPR